MFEPNHHSKWQIHWKSVSQACSAEICTLLRQSYGFTGVQSVTLVDEEWQQASRNYKIIGQRGGDSYCVLVRKNLMGGIDTFRLIASISSYLREHFLAVPQIIPTVESASLVSYNGHFWQVFQFIKGDHFRGRLDELIQSGIAIGQMHQVLNIFPLRKKIPVLNEVLAPLSRDCLDEVAPVRQENELDALFLEQELFIKEKIRQILDRIASVHEREDIIHCDLHPHNFLFFDKQLAAIIDFGQISSADKEYDIAMACHRLVRQYVVYREKPWQETLAEGVNFFLNSYIDIIPMSDQQIRLLPVFATGLLLRKIVYNFLLYKIGKRSWEPALSQIKKFLCFFEEIDAIGAVLV